VKRTAGDLEMKPHWPTCGVSFGVLPTWNLNETHLWPVLDKVGDLYVGASSVRPASRSPGGVSVEGGAELSGEDDRAARWLDSAVDCGGEVRGVEPLI
jgi:hypothetical protein